MTAILKSCADHDLFDDLVRRVEACRRCPRMEGRRRVLSRANGSLDAPLLFVAEAPGRLGGDRTGIPLVHDQSGRNFTRLLAGADIPRDQVFVTNAVLCNPRDAAGRNATPEEREIARCGPFLRETLTLVHAPIVVTLGRIALGALARIHPHNLELRRAVGSVTPWNGRLLVPLYHPGPRAQAHRSFEQQQQDFIGLAHLYCAHTSGTLSGAAGS